MKPYTTTVEHLLPGMIVRTKDRWQNQTTVLRVDYTFLYGTGGACIGERSVGIEVEEDAEITVLHDPMHDEQDVQMSVEMLSDEKITPAIRRSVEQVMAYHRGRPPQQYNTGGLDLLRNPYGQ